uniref:F-box and wd40 domain protein n=1 Tax=Solanum tuberosum TaxID=4113 RepID=M1D832_SOLTU
MEMDGSKRVFQWLGPSSQGDNSFNKQQTVCFHWRAERCNRFPSLFLHRDLPEPPQQQQHTVGNGMPSSKRGMFSEVVSLEPYHYLLLTIELLMGSRHYIS